MLFFLFLLLLILNITYIVFLCKKESIFKQGLEINHTLLFCIGLFSYWIFPIIIGLTGLFKHQPLLDDWYQIFDDMHPLELISYMVFITLFISSFYLGNIAFNKYKRKIMKFIPKKAFWNPSINQVKYPLNILYVLSLIPLVYFLVIFQDAFFMSYTSKESLSNIKGSFVSLSSVYLSMALLYSLYKANNPSLTNKKYIYINKYTITYVIVSLLLLSLGGRLYFLSGIIMVFVLWTVYYRTIPIKFFVIFITTSALLMGILGVIRLGNSITGIEPIIFNIIAEPVYTSFSLIYFIAYESISMFKFPIFLLSEFLNFIPTVIFPNKTDYFISPNEFGYVIHSPVGALNSYVSFMINFGFAGSLVFIFIFSFFLNTLKFIGEKVIYIRVIYVMLSGWLLFTFFRDPFSVSIIKNMIQFSILVPIFFMIIIKIYNTVRERWGSKE